jgi:hypothetical protein
MTTPLQLAGEAVEQLRATPLAPYAGIYEGYPGEGGFAPSTKGGYLRCLGHFGRWMSQGGLDAEDLDETSSRNFSTSTCRVAGVRLRLCVRARLFGPHSGICWSSCASMR